MYLDRAEEDDKKAAEMWKGDADGILVFVCCPRTRRYCLAIVHTLIIILFITDRFVLSHGRGLSCRDLPDPSTQLAGHLHVLSRNHHPNLGRFQCIATNHFAPPATTESIRVQATQIGHLVQFALVLESRAQSYLRFAGHLAAAMGSPVRPRDATPPQPSQARTNSRFFRRGYREVAFTLGRRGVARFTSYFCVPFLRRSRRVLVHRPPNGLFDRARVHGSLRWPIPVHHPVAHLSP